MLFSFRQNISPSISRSSIIDQFFLASKLYGLYPIEEKTITTNLTFSQRNYYVSGHQRDIAAAPLEDYLY